MESIPKPPTKGVVTVTSLNGFSAFAGFDVNAVVVSRCVDDEIACHIAS